MPSFSMKPLELNDFSGGMTDNYLTAGPTHYQHAENFFITVDKHMQQRYGTVVLDSTAYAIPGNPRRVGGLYTFINDSILLAQQDRNIYWYNPNTALTPILGSNNQEALSAGTDYNAVVAAEWNRHMYFASDAQPQPVKIFRDSTNTFQVRTAGLPRATGTANLSNDQVLNLGCNLANSIQQSMIAHVQDTTLHLSSDAVNLARIQIVPQATSLATLVTLLNALSTAYESHRSDASLNGARTIHRNFNSTTSGWTSPLQPTGMHVKLSNSTTITTPTGGSGDAAILLTCAAAVDDLAQKWYWHRLAIWTHGPTVFNTQSNNYAIINRYAVTAPKIGLINTGQAVATANLTDMFNFVNNIKYYYNTHLADGAGSLTGGAHKTSNPASGSSDDWRIPLPDCTDYDSCAVMIFWLRCMYNIHYSDAAYNTFRTILFDTTAGSTLLFNINYANPYFAGANLLNQWLYSPGNWQGGVTSVFLTNGGGTGLATSSAKAGGTSTQISGQASFSQFHVSLTSSGAQLDSYPAPVGTWAPASASIITSQVDSVGTDASTWMALAQEVFFTLAEHMADNTVHNAANAINISNNVTYTVPYAPFFVPTIASYSYAFTFSDQYTVETGGLQYLVESNPIFIDAIETSTIIPAGATVLSSDTGVYSNVTYTTLQSVTLSNLPSITNTASTNYNTSNILLNIYRTSDGGVTWYRLTQLANGTATYTDKTADSVSYSGFPALTTLTTLYTTGGIVGNDQPPQAGCLTMLNNTMYYGNIVDTGQNFPNRIRQTLPGNPDSAPATFTDDLEDDIVALSSTRSVIIALCKKSIYRLNGGFNSLGQGTLTHERISDTAGCVSAKSVVRTEVGVFYAGTDGFYYTDGYQIIKISLELNQRYQNHTTTSDQQKRIQGAYDKLNRRIMWTMQANASDTNPNSIWLFYLDYGIKPGGVFTTYGNGSWMRPSTVAWFNNQLVYGHEQGFIFKTDPYTKTDPKWVVGTNPSTWNTVYMPYYYAGASLDFGSLFKRKYNTKVHYVGNSGYLSGGNMAIQLQSVRDNDMSQASNLAMINYTYQAMWGDPTVKWQPGDAVNPYPWEYDHKNDSWRRFPAGQLRCDTRQIIIKPAFVGVYRSEDWPPFCFASTNGTTKVVTIATPSGYTNIIWPPDVVDYVIAFSNDNYVKTYTITSVGTTTLTVSDPGSTLTNLANQGWVIRGYKKAQRVHFNSLIIYYDYLGDENTSYTGAGSAGENT